MQHNVAWETSEADECFVSASCTGIKVVERRDALGRTIERWHYDDGLQVKARTQFDYDEQGRLVKTRQGDAAVLNDNTAVSTTYDRRRGAELPPDPAADNTDRP